MASACVDRLPPRRRGRVLVEPRNLRVKHPGPAQQTTGIEKPVSHGYPELKREPTLVIATLDDLNGAIDSDLEAQ